MGLGLIAVALIVLSKTEHISVNHRKAWSGLVGVWAGYALIDILLKYTSSLGLKLPMTLNLVFIMAFVFSFVYVYVFAKQNMQIKNVLGGLLLEVSILPILRCMFRHMCCSKTVLRLYLQA